MHEKGFRYTPNALKTDIERNRKKKQPKTNKTKKKNPTNKRGPRKNTAMLRVVSISFHSSRRDSDGTGPEPVKVKIADKIRYR